MTLVDSSAWIEYYRKGGRETYKEWVTRAIEQDEAAVNPIIVTEILAFVHTEREFDTVQSDFSSLHWLPLDESEAEIASRLGFRLRRQGVTIPAADLLIFASAVTSRSALIHHDAHFIQLGDVESVELMSLL